MKFNLFQFSYEYEKERVLRFGRLSLCPSRCFTGQAGYPLPSSPAGLREFGVVSYSSSAVAPPCASPLRVVVRLLQVSKWLAVLGAAPEEKRGMDAAASRSSRGFEDEDDEESEFGRREGASHKGDSLRI